MLFNVGNLVYGAALVLFVWQITVALRQRYGYDELRVEKQGTRVLVVRQKGRLRQLVHRGVSDSAPHVQTSMTTDGTLISKSVDPIGVIYTDVMHLTSVFTPEPRRLLFLGAGGGVLPQQCAARFAGSRSDVVDLDATTLALAQEYFGLASDGRTAVHTADALEFLRNAPDGAYDGIFVDVFDRGEMPESIRSPEFTSLLHRKLSAEGVVAMNVIGAYSGKLRGIVDEMFGHLSTTFGPSRSFRVGVHQPMELGMAELLYRYTRRNFILLGTRADAPDAATLERRVLALRLPMLPGAHRHARRLAGDLRSRR